MPGVVAGTLLVLSPLLVRKWLGRVGALASGAMLLVSPTVMYYSRYIRHDIPVELFIGDREHRMREGLCHNIALKPFMGGRKVAVIDDADDGADDINFACNVDAGHFGSFATKQGTAVQKAFFSDTGND